MFSAFTKLFYAQTKQQEDSEDSDESEPELIENILLGKDAELYKEIQKDLERDSFRGKG